jgi:hypothetical protein
LKCLVKELSADINRATHDGSTPLMVASNYKRADVVRWLVKEGADTQASTPKRSGEGFLTAADFSKDAGASAEQTAYLEAKTYCSNPGCSGAGIKRCSVQAGAVLRGDMPVCPLEGAQGRLQAVERGAQGGQGHGRKWQVKECAMFYV